MMKKIFISIFTIFIVLFAGGAGSKVFAESLKNPAVYFSPHQDDELLSMGADISRQYRSGRQVIIVLVTNGNASIARERLCCRKKVCLTKEQFTAARNAEMTAGVKQLAPHAVIRYENYQDGALTKPQAVSVIDKYMKLYPHASFATVSWTDEHPDHRVLAYALNEACVKKHRTSEEDCRFFQDRRYWLLRPVRGSFVAGNPSEFTAADEMARWNPPKGRYGIASQSVPESFIALRHDPRDKYHSCMSR